MKNTDELGTSIYNGLARLANAITPSNAAAGHDAAGGAVQSLTEAVIGITAALVRIAAALEESNEINMHRE